VSGARFLVGDTRTRTAQLPDNSVDLVMTSPPFLALRSYLPADHPDKHREIGSEATPAAFLDTLLALTAEWGRVLAPHGSIVVELGDTYAGSGGAGGDWIEGSGQRVYTRGSDIPDFTSMPQRKGAGWPLDKSLCFIPSLYAASLAYGRNLLRAPLPARQMLAFFEIVALDMTRSAELAEVQPPSALDLIAMMRDWLGQHERLGPTIEYEPWRVRNLVAWVRPNPPVGRLGDKFRNATSYLTIACRARDRWFDLDAVRTPHSLNTHPRPSSANGRKDTPSGNNLGPYTDHINPAGAPPLDWWNIPPTGYGGAHYAVYPPALCERPIQAMCPRRVCTTCGQPSRRIVVDRSAFDRQPELAAHIREQRQSAGFTLRDVDGWFGLNGMAAHWESTSSQAAVPAPTWWPELSDRLGLDRDRFDDLVFGERRWTESLVEYGEGAIRGFEGDRAMGRGGHQGVPRADRHLGNHGWSSCGCPGADGIQLDGYHTGPVWRPGHVLDPFAGTGTTLVVAHGHGRDSTGIDLDPRNALLAQQRLGMFLTIHEPETAA
jgi:DNA modification methylase